jgi:hypothetical protein
MRKFFSGGIIVLPFYTYLSIMMLRQGGLHAILPLLAPLVLYMVLAKPYIRKD